MKTKKFKFTFEIDAIPYNKKTYRQFGDYFLENTPECHDAVNMIGRVLQSATIQNFSDASDGLSKNSSDKEKCKRILKKLGESEKVIKQIEESLKIAE